MPIHPLIEGVKEFYKNPIKNIREMAKTDEFKNRHEANDLSTAASAQVPDNQATPLRQAVERVFMSPTTNGIKWTDAAIMYAARKHYMSEAGGSMSEAEATAKGAEIAHNSQVSSALDLQSNLARNPIGKWLSIFQGQMTRMSQEVYLNWDRYFTTHDPEHLKLAVKTSLVAATNVVIFEGINAAWNMALAKDDKSAVRAFMDGFTRVSLALAPYANYPLIKDVEAGMSAKAVSSVIHTKSEPEFTTLPFKFLDNGLKLWGDETDYVVANAEGKGAEWMDQNWFSVLIDAHNFVGWALGSPFESPLNTARKASKSKLLNGKPTEGTSVF
jgi:hypothetical protein